MNIKLTNTPVSAVLFDLDDTLYDHLHSARQGLVGLANRYPYMQSISLTELERRFSDILEHTHTKMLQGEMNQDEARCIRFQHLFESFGVKIDRQQALEDYGTFRSDYDANRKVVAGSHELLSRLRSMDLRLAVITNNMTNEQLNKLKMLELSEYFEVVSISEQIGAAKPDPEIYMATLDRLQLTTDDVVMVGDSLTTDIAGATALNIRSVWLKRHVDSPVKAPAAVATIERDLSDLDHCVNSILTTPN